MSYAMAPMLHYVSGMNTMSIELFLTLPATIVPAATCRVGSTQVGCGGLTPASVVGVCDDGYIAVIECEFGRYEEWPADMVHAL